MRILSWISAFLICLVSAGVWTTAARGQRGATLPQQPVFRTTTDLIQVDTVVVDKDGKPMHGLTKEDFEIFDNGKQQDVAVLTEYRHERVALGPGVDPPHVDVATNSGPAAQRLVVVVLDDLHTRLYHADRVKAAVGQFLHEIGGQLQMALIRTSGRPGIEFTADPRMLLDAIAAFQGELMVGEGRGGDNSLGLGRMPSGPIPRPGAGGSIARVEDALGFLSPNDGRRKTLLFVSENSVGSVDPRDAAAMIDPAKTPAERLAAQRDIFDSLPEVVRHVIEVARRANASIYAIDPRGLAQPGQEGFSRGSGGLSDGMAFATNDVARKEQAKLVAMAAETGGYAVVNTDDFAAGVARIVDELDNYYVLGFRAPDPKATKPHEIEVRVSRAGAEARYRHEYVLNTGPTKADQAGKKDALLGLAHSPVPTGDLPLKLWATVSSPERGAKEARVGMWLDNGDAGISEYAIYVVDLKKAKQTEKPISRTLAGNAPSLLPLESVMLLPGRYQLRVSARSQDASVGGSVYLTIDVPDFAKTPLAITGLLLGEGDTRRRDLGALPFAPTLDRAFGATARLRVAFDVGRQPQMGDARAVVEILSAAGAIVQKVDDRTLPPGSGHVEAPFALAGLAPGTYILRFTATSGASSAREEIGFQIRR
jgi:VWFA-related protein